MKKTPLHSLHLSLNAKMVDFGGWHMPVQYTGLSQEHHATRSKCGIFDVSHMGEVHVSGTQAEDFLNFLVTNNVSKLEVGQAQYTVMCYENGGIVDDLLVYKRGNQKYLLCINASNTEKDYAWIADVAKKFPNVTVANASEEYCQIALQGPLAPEILERICTSAPWKDLKYYRFLETTVLGANTIISRTGYTGEDGFELYAPAGSAEKIWTALLEAGTPSGLLPCGLGARDTLRTEMKFPLYGHEITAETNPLEAGLGWVTKLDKQNDFMGKAALAKIKAAGPARTLVGFRSLERAIPRQNYRLYDASGTKEIGVVTSGTLSPSLNYPIGIGYVSLDNSTVGSKLMIQVRENMVPGEIVKTPFYQRLK